MKSLALKKILTDLAVRYAEGIGAGHTVHETAVIFTRLQDNFLPASFEAISANPGWQTRTEKAHQNVPGVHEMQSSNSSDALLMNVFCHPAVSGWKGVWDCLQVAPQLPVFGYKPGVAKMPTEARPTEIDLALQEVFLEAKLTEEGFSQKEAKTVEAYTNLSEWFHVAELDRRGGAYAHYQIIRNLLGAIEHGRRHLLLCDERRPDLVRSYFRVVVCLKEVEHRRRCGVVFWQELARGSAKDLREFLALKYGIE